MSWNSYPKQVRNSLLERLNSNMIKTKKQTGDDCKKVWLILQKSDEKFNSKIKQSFNENVKFRKRYLTNKLAMICSNKDHIQCKQEANVIYRITCPGCYNKNWQKYYREIGRKRNKT